MLWPKISSSKEGVGAAFQIWHVFKSFSGPFPTSERDVAECKRWRCFGYLHSWWLMEPYSTIQIHHLVHSLKWNSLVTSLFVGKIPAAPTADMVKHCGTAPHCWVSVGRSAQSASVEWLKMMKSARVLSAFAVKCQFNDVKCQLPHDTSYKSFLAMPVFAVLPHCWKTCCISAALKPCRASTRPWSRAAEARPEKMARRRWFRPRILSTDKALTGPTNVPWQMSGTFDGFLAVSHRNTGVQTRPTPSWKKREKWWRSISKYFHHWALTVSRWCSPLAKNTVLMPRQRDVADSWPWSLQVRRDQQMSMWYIVTWWILVNSGDLLFLLWC